MDRIDVLKLLLRWLNWLLAVMFAVSALASIRFLFEATSWPDRTLMGVLTLLSLNRLDHTLRELHDA